MKYSLDTYSANIRIPNLASRTVNIFDNFLFFLLYANSTEKLLAIVFIDFILRVLCVFTLSIKTNSLQAAHSWHIVS